MIRVTTVARSDVGVFMAHQDGEGYLVFSLDDVREIEVGDVLAHSSWTDQDGLFFPIQNLTKKEEIRICLENWSMNLDTAKGFLERLNSPKRFLRSQTSTSPPPKTPTCSGAKSTVKELPLCLCPMNSVGAEVVATTQNATKQLTLFLQKSA